MSIETPVQARSAARVAVAKLLRGALHAADVDQGEVARLVGTTAQKVQRWCDRLERETPGFADVILMPRAVAMPLLRWAAEHHGALVVDQLEAASALDHMGHLHRVLKESADVSVAYSSALADGVVDPVERERLISELRESIHAQQSVLQLLEGEGRVRLVGGAS